MAVVLVIEDDDHLRRLLRTVLERAGYTVEDAPNGAAGLKRFSTCRSEERRVGKECRL